MKKVSVIIPCRNEAQAIEKCISNVYHFDKPDGGYEIIVIDGMSDDGTRDILYDLQKQFPDLIVIDNPEKTVPHAMNLGIKHAKGEYIIRADVRCIHPKRYLVDLISLEERTGADNVGGVLEPIGESYLQKGIAASYKSLISMGGALRERCNFEGETDAVYGGCFKRERLLEVGMYDENMVRNQDDELSFRLRKNGGKIVQSSNIRIQYYPRKNLKQLFKQFLQYGFWKVFVINKHPEQGSIRHIAPMILVLTLASSGTLTIFNQKHGLISFVVTLVPYLSIVLIESIRVAIKDNLKLIPAVIGSILTIHFRYGIVFIIGIATSCVSKHPKWVTTLSR